MSELALIKEEIYNLGLVAPLLESMGCDVNPNNSSNERIEACRPGGSNPRSVQVRLNEGLFSTVRSRAHVPIRDIYDIVSYFVYDKKTTEEFNKNLSKSKRYIVNTLNLTGFEDGEGRLDTDPNGWLREIKRRRKQEFRLSDIEPNIVLPESVMDGFVKYPHIDWINDDISYEAQEEFEVVFDIQSERISFPIRNSKGEIVGVKGRATRVEDEDKYKYMPIYSFRKGIELYNLHRAMPYIQDQKEVILFESEKSCMKAYEFGVHNTVSQMGSELTKVQAEIVKRLTPDIKVILAYDKDKTPDEVKQFARVFDNYDNIHGIVDVDDLLGDKEAPVDRSKGVWEKLYSSNCYKITASS